LLLRVTGHAISEGAFVLSDIGCVRGDVNEANDIRVNASLRDDRAAVAVTDQDGWAF
jgi:hypothetical protein